jgi:hypothetical protein
MPERRLSFILIGTLLTLSLGAWVLTTALSMTIGKPAQAEALLNKSGIYQAVIPSQVADAQKSNPSLQNLPLDNPEIQKVLGDSLDAHNLQVQGNKAVEAIYGWLEGKSDKPQINIAVLANQQALAVAAGDYAAKYAAKLPVCGPGEADYAGFASDPLSSSCLPPGTDAAMVRSTVQNAVATNPALGTSTQLTENDVKLTNGKTIMDSFNTAPKWYQRSQKLPLITAILAVICVLLLVLILKPARGVKSAGKHLLSVGIVMVLVAYGLAWCFEKFNSFIIPPNSNPNIGSALSKLSNLFNAAYRDNIVHLSLYLAAGGVVLLAVAFILKHLHHSSAGAPVARAAKLGSTTEPESLSSAPAVASFIPIGPPKLPGKKTTKAAAKKKPAATRHKKKK